MDGETTKMDAKQQDNLIYVGVCVLMLLLSLAGLAYGFMSEMILAPDAPFTLDGILLALICLTVAGIFKVMLIVHAFQQGWIKWPAKKSAEPPAEAKQ